jgi:hypothetical protein
MAEFDFMNMFAPRGAPSGLDALLSADQRKLMGRNANLSAAAALLAASGPSRQRVGLGQALGAALQAGQQGYQQARAGSLQEMLLGEKLKESQAAKARQASIEGIISTGIRPATPGMPAQMVEEEGRFLGETPAVAARPAGFDIQAIAPQLMAQGPEGRKAFGELLAAQKTLMGDTFSLAEGAKQYRVDPITGAVTEVAAGAPKREPVPGEIQAYKLAQDQGFTGSFVDFKNSLRPPTAPPSAVAEYQFAVSQGYKGTFEQFNQAQRQSSASRTTVNMPGNQQFLAGVGTDISKTLSDLTAGANAANSTLANVDRILPALDKAVLGPGADYRTTLLRIGQQLGVAGANANDTLAQTATVVQGLAQAELDAAAQMKGQGTLTDAERAILRRAAGGDQSLTAAEIQTGLRAAQKNAQARLKLQADYVQRASKLPGFEQFAPLYQVTPYTGGNNPLVNLIDQTLQQRQGRR